MNHLDGLNASAGINNLGITGVVLDESLARGTNSIR